MSVRSVLRERVFELAENQCEHPMTFSVLENRHVRCRYEAVELAHIVPRGMGHTGYRDTFDNVMAACERHARTTDDLSALEWQVNVPPPHDRKALSEWVKADRERRGYGFLEGSDL